MKQQNKCNEQIVFRQKHLLTSYSWFQPIHNSVMYPQFIPTSTSGVKPKILILKSNKIDIAIKFLDSEKKLMMTDS